jgi:hypothetical protein
LAGNIPRALLMKFALVTLLLALVVGWAQQLLGTDTGIWPSDSV